MIKEVLLSLMLMTSVAVAGDFPYLQDPALTPGAVLTTDADTLCRSGYSKTVRNVPKSLKDRVFDEYMTDPKSDKFEVDHLISLELGGSNSIKNLWPQSYTTKPWNAHHKDKLENRLHKEICDLMITPQSAQEEIRKDWIAAYCLRFDDNPEGCK